MTRLIDRMLARGSYDNYSEYAYSGAYQVTASDPSGRHKEGVPAGVVRHARDAYESNGIVFACIAISGVAIRAPLPSGEDMKQLFDLSTLDFERLARLSKRMFAAKASSLPIMTCWSA